ncbi:MAG: hypothetical protein L3J51_11975 [Cocleimonas sp.]|nr:hypothetical protein [Cocleimonas sp.]
MPEATYHHLKWIPAYAGMTNTRNDCLAQPTPPSFWRRPESMPEAKCHR